MQNKKGGRGFDLPSTALRQALAYLSGQVKVSDFRRGWGGPRPFLSVAATHAAHQLELATVRTVLGPDCRQHPLVQITQSLLEAVEVIGVIIHGGQLQV